MASAYKNSPKWVKRIETFFMQSDLDKNGYLSLEDFEMLSQNLAKKVKAAPELLDKLHKATHDYWVSAGVKPGVQLTKNQFVDKMASYCAAQKAKYEKGEKLVQFSELNDAWYAVCDTDGDGFISLKEYETMLSAANFDAGTAKIAFDTIDTNHDGQLSWEEMEAHNIQFWLNPDDARYTGMYGPKYE